MAASDFGSIQSAPAIRAVNGFLASPWFVAVAAVLTLCANIFSAELAVYTAVVLIAVYVCIFGKDFTPLMPLMIFCYCAPSVKNNPGSTDASIFARGFGGGYILCLAAVVAVALLYRLIRDRRKVFATKPRLVWGILILMAGYLLGGLGAGVGAEVTRKNLLFAGLQGLAILLPYLLFCVGVDWKTVRKDYFAWVGFFAGCLLVAEIIWIYLTAGVVTEGVIDRNRVFTGWGMRNNIGGLLAMMIPFAFCLATRYRKGWMGTVAGTVFYAAVCLTCSRSSMLFGGLIYGVCIVLMLRYANNRRGNTIALITMAGVAGLVILLFREPLLRLFSDLLDNALEPSSRDVMYKEGFRLFLKHPVFGSTFYPSIYAPWEWSTAEAFTGFFPPRWHNTVIQLLASCGVVGLLAYGVHRIQTIRLFWKAPRRETVFVGCSVLTLLLCSLLDCHFFNIGPVLFYAMALAFTENYHKIEN